MHKRIAVLGAIALLFVGQIAAAQSYSYSAGTCVNLSRDISLGARGADVSQLQNFLVAQNFPGGGGWMVTGYFGKATAAALRNYQSQHNLPMTGMLDSMTRSAIALCGTPSAPAYPSYPTALSYPTYPAYPTYPYQGSVTISSLSTSASTPGSTVTVYGTGFQYGSTMIHFGSMNIAPSSVNDSSITFVVPQIAQGSYQLFVTTNLGTSNVLSFSITPSYPCTMYPYGSCGVCNGAPNYGYGVIGLNFGTFNCAGGSVSISYLSPTSGAVGSQVTIYGSGFSSTGNTVRFGQGNITNISSFDGTSLTFTVPGQLSGYGSNMVYLATYNVSVTNAAGQTSNALPFTVTSLNPAGTPSIAGISGPNALATGSSGTWTITLTNLSTTVNTYTNVSVNWGDSSSVSGSAAIAQGTYPQGTQTLSFTHAYATAGTYTVTFTASNTSGQTAIATATVSVNGPSTSGQALLSYVTPSSGRVGTQVVLVGSGFSALDNTIHFGAGGMMHVVSNNGTTMYFTVPSYVSPCDVITSGQVCALYAQQVTPGTYQMYVTNQSGTTNSVTFTVTP